MKENAEKLQFTVLCINEHKSPLMTFMFIYSLKLILYELELPYIDHMCWGLMVCVNGIIFYHPFLFRINTSNLVTDLV